MFIKRPCQLLLYNNFVDRQQMEQIVKTNDFIAKFDSILNNASFSDIIAYDRPHAKITIFDRQRFQTQIIPFYFRHSKFTSFIRQLNLYGFKKIKKQEFLCFTHSVIQKGQQQALCYKRFRNIVAKRKLNLIKIVQLPSNQGQEPHQQINQTVDYNRAYHTLNSPQESNILDRFPILSTYPFPFQSSNGLQGNLLRQEENLYNIILTSPMNFCISMSYQLITNPVMMSYVVGPS